MLGITVGIEHGNDVIGANLKYETVPADVAAKPVNLYARGILTRTAVEDIGESPEETHRVTEAVQRLFDAAPALVKLLRKDKAYRDKLLADIGNWDRENPIHVNSDGTADYIWITVEPYPYGISYNGRYYTRSGGVSKELQGAELSAFLLKVSGKCAW